MTSTAWLILTYSNWEFLPQNNKYYSNNISFTTMAHITTTHLKQQNYFSTILGL